LARKEEVAARCTTGKKVSAKEMRALNIERHDFRGDWNYVVHPRSLNV